MKTAAATQGPESVAFGSSSPSTSAISDAVDWIVRLVRAFGSPNYGNYIRQRLVRRSLDVKGGNVLFSAVRSNAVDGTEFLAADRPATVGADRRPLGPARFGYVTGEDLYGAILDGRITTLVGFGGNPVMAHADSGRGRDALRRLDFFVQADLFMTPTAGLADIVLPVTTPLESEALKVGFEYSQEAQSNIEPAPFAVPQ